jgi:hypothetical protein
MEPVRVGFSRLELRLYLGFLSHTTRGPERPFTAGETKVGQNWGRQFCARPSGSAPISAVADLRVPRYDRLVLFARPSGSAAMAEYLRRRKPPFSVHTTLGWTIVKTQYAPVQYVLAPRTLTTCLMA